LDFDIGSLAKEISSMASDEFVIQDVMVKYVLKSPEAARGRIFNKADRSLPVLMRLVWEKGRGGADRAVWRIWWILIKPISKPSPGPSLSVGSDAEGKTWKTRKRVKKSVA
jgi:hypothetical protein